MTDDHEGANPMRYMMLVRSDERKNQAPPDPKLMETIGKLTEEMNRAGIVVATGGLLPSAAGALADFEPERG
jgi:hypothetical protein